MFKDVLSSDKRSLNPYDDRFNVLSTYNLNDMNSAGTSAPFQYHYQHKPSHVDLHQYNDQIDKR